MRASWDEAKTARRCRMMRSLGMRGGDKEDRAAA
jgi:hypothetical protein